MYQTMPVPCRSRYAAVAAAQRALPVEEVEPFGRRDAALRGGAPLTAGAAITALAPLERHFRRHATSFANHAATEIASPVPAASPGPLPSRGGATCSLSCHVSHSPLPSSSHTARASLCDGRGASDSPLRHTSPVHIGCHLPDAARPAMWTLSCWRDVRCQSTGGLGHMAETGNCGLPCSPCCGNARSPESPAPLHALVLGPAPSLARRPARSHHIGRLAVHTVGRVGPQHPVDHLVHARRTQVGVECGRLRAHILADHEMYGDRVARRVAGLEDAINLAEGDLAIRGHN